MNKDVGRFSISGWEPYPVWMSIHKDGEGIRFSHEDLPDLEHCVSELRRHVSKELPDEPT